MTIDNIPPDDYKLISIWMNMKPNLRIRVEELNAWSKRRPEEYILLKDRMQNEEYMLNEAIVCIFVILIVVVIVCYKIVSYNMNIFEIEEIISKLKKLIRN